MITFDYDALIKQFDNRFHLVLAIVDRVKLLKRGVEARVSRRGRDLISVAIEEFTGNHLEWETEDNYWKERQEELARRGQIGERDTSETFFDDEDFVDEFFDEAFDGLNVEGAGDGDEETKAKPKRKKKKAAAASAEEDAEGEEGVEGAEVVEDEDEDEDEDEEATDDKADDDDDDTVTGDDVVVAEDDKPDED